MIPEPRGPAIVATRWSFDTEELRSIGVKAVFAALRRSGRLVRAGVFAGVEDLSLFVYTQWSDVAQRDEYIASGGLLVPGGPVDWRTPANLVRSYGAAAPETAGCLVVVRQPLDVPDRGIQRSWIDTVTTALESDGAPIGLHSAHFFASEDGECVLNLALWRDPESHLAALRHAMQRANYGTFAKTPAWRATRSHPGIRVDHDVRRYRLLGEPGGDAPPGAVEHDR